MATFFTTTGYAIALLAELFKSYAYGLRFFFEDFGLTYYLALSFCHCLVRIWISVREHAKSVLVCR